jgi:hypothetical protein
MVSFFKYIQELKKILAKRTRLIPEIGKIEVEKKDYYYLKCLLGLKDILHYFFRPHTGGALIYVVRYDTRANHRR